MDRLIQLTTKNLVGALNLLLVIFCAYVAAQVVHNIRRPAPVPAAAARPAPKVPPPVTAARTFKAYQPILDRNLFKSTLKEEAKPAPAEVPEEIEESQLKARLVATIVSADETKSTATIEDLSTREKAIYHTNDPFMKAAKVVRIERERVVVLRNGKHEKLSLYDEEGNIAGGGRAAPGAPVLNSLGQRVRPGAVAPQSRGREIQSREARQRAGRGSLQGLSDFNTKNKEFRVMPRFNQGKISGFRVFALSSTSTWAKSGLRNGDVVRSIGGRNVSNVNQLYDFLSELEESGPISVGVERGGQQQTITYAGGS
jgi:general secretion pathway protein C